jgi:hypothetical protein
MGECPHLGLLQSLYDVIGQSISQSTVLAIDETGSYPALVHKPCEVLETPVKGLFCIVRKAASRELSHAQVISYALATNPLSWTRLIGAIAVLEIPLLLALHDSSSYA